MYCNNILINNIGIFIICLLLGCGFGGNVLRCGLGGCGLLYVGNVFECGFFCGGKGLWGGVVCGLLGGK